MKQTITDLEGVYANAIDAGIKADGLDLAYIYVPDAVASAAVFTQHKFSASSVSYTKRCIKHNTLKAIIINSGNANAVTGKQGHQDTKTIVKLVAEKLNIKANQVGIAATGIIGKLLPMKKVESGLNKLLHSPTKKHANAVAEAILTTDLVSKTTFIEKKVGKKMVAIAGMTKGSGMIAPNMATTLGFLVTNANLPQAILQRCLTTAVKLSYNMLSVDTDTSTNDMLVCLATGQYKINPTDKPSLDAFQDALNEAAIDLAKQIAKDGEGASKLIQVDVRNAVNVQGAQKIAKLVVDSPLVKTAIHGEDPNWGRIVMAIGKDTSIKLNPEKVSIKIGDFSIFSNGAPIDFDRQLLKKELANSTIFIIIDCAIGNASATAWGCDLTKGYIDINTDYN